MTIKLAKSLGIAAGVAAVLSLAPAGAQDRDHRNVPSDRDSGRQVGDTNEPQLAITDVGKLVNKLHFVNLLEIRQAELVKQRSQRDFVRDFADDIIKDHRKLDDKVVKFARDKHIEIVEPTLKAGAPKDEMGHGATTGQVGGTDAEHERQLQDLKRLESL
ncbi:MAG TPA: DUF4142 domain-containing protein, partial [Planctomycetota bacterium]|nr:DUF4142 domain-containing protein [Planctomycetota bacterium]